MICWYRVQVHADAQRVGREAAEANVIAAECQASLEIAYPALTAAEEALNVLTKADMAELKVRPRSQRDCLSATIPSLNMLLECSTLLCVTVSSVKNRSVVYPTSGMRQVPCHQVHMGAS